jgi:hypothetical protein
MLVDYTGKEVVRQSALNPYRSAHWLYVGILNSKPNATTTTTTTIYKKPLYQ